MQNELLETHNNLFNCDAIIATDSLSKDKLVKVDFHLPNFFLYVNFVLCLYNILEIIVRLIYFS